MVCNEDKQSELNVSPLVEKVDEYKNIWREHVLTMEKDSVTKAAYFYAPQGSRNVERIRKRWSDF